MWSPVIISRNISLLVMVLLQVPFDGMSIQGITSRFFPGLVFPAVMVKEKSIIQIAAAKTMLEMEADPMQVKISGTEVFSIPDSSGKMENGMPEINRIREQLNPDTGKVCLWIRYDYDVEDRAQCEE